eukprot:1787835-Rhodomonas_salina.2
MGSLPPAALQVLVEESLFTAHASGFRGSGFTAARAWRALLTAHCFQSTAHCSPFRRVPPYAYGNSVASTELGACYYQAAAADGEEAKR